MRRVAALSVLGMGVNVPNVLAQGGPPMLTDDPGTPGPGRWEINLAATTSRTRNSAERELPLLDINYGVGERIQLKYEVAWLWRDDDATGSQSGLGNSLAGIKVRFYDAGTAGWQVSTYPQVEFHNPGSDSARRELTEGGTSVFLPFEFQRAFESVSINFELGHAFRSQGDDEWAAGVVLGSDFSDRVEMMAELHSAATESFSQTEITLNIGARVGFADAGTLLLSVGSDLHNTMEERATVLAYAGWQLRR